MRTDLKKKIFLAKRLLFVKLCGVSAFLLLAFSISFRLEAGNITQSITLKMKDAPLDKVFKAIEQQSKYYFVYNSGQIKQAKSVTIDVAHATLEQALAICFKEQSFSYTVVDNLVVVKSKEKPHTSLGSTMENKIGTEPPIEVKGRVLNSKGEPVPGVTITIKGIKKSTFTNLEGEFSFQKVDPTATLVFTGANVETSTVPVAGQRQLSVTLAVKMSKLDEVQVIAYGSTTPRFNTGNVTTVSGEDIRKQPVNNFLLALQGRVPGLQITQMNGVAGGAVKIRLQGQNSILAGNNPLFVVDGVPYPATNLPTVTGGTYSILGNTETGQVFNKGGNGSPLTYISPSDIESVEVLKDADATSIYGSRAANGAILITTRKGKAGRTKIDYNFQTGWSRQTRYMKMMNTDQYLSMRKEALRNDNILISPTDANYDVNGLWDTTRNTDWVKMLANNGAKYINTGLTMSGGTQAIQYLIGGNYNRQTTPFSGDFSDQRASLHFNIASSSQNQKFKIQLTGSYMDDNNQLPQADPSGNAYSLPPNAPALYKPDGTLNWAPNLSGNSSWTNPLATLNNRYQNLTDNLMGNLQLNYKIAPSLTVSTNAGYSKLYTREIITVLATSVAPESRTNSSRSAQYTYSTFKTWLIEPQLNYRRMFGRGKLDVLLGATIQQNAGSGQTYGGSGFVSDALVRDIKSASTISVGSTIESVYKYNAAFGRVNYNLLDKYIVNLSMRRDGSSRFGPENRFHNFGSVGAAWIFSEEMFFKNNVSFIAFGKIRASYGTTGSDQIGDYQYMDLYASNTPAVPYQNSASLAVSGIPNPYLEWEQNRKLSLGLDIGLKNDVVLLSVVYGRNRSSNQLLSYSLPIIAGFTSVYKNFPATIENTNWEFVLNTINIARKDFNWKTNINLTLPDNRLVSFPDLSTSTYKNSLVVGQPLSIVRAYHFMGVDPATGLYMFADSHGSPTATSPASANNILINTLPKFYGGINNSFSFKGVSIDFLFQFVKQIGFDIIRYGVGSPPGAAKSNQPVFVSNNHWERPGDIADIQRYGTTGVSNSFYALSNSDVDYKDASYLRLKNITASYNFPLSICRRVRVDNFRVFFQGQDLLTITPYGALDPESQSYNSLPPLKTFVFGISVAF